jgi:hypothetical protein
MTRNLRNPGRRRWALRLATVGVIAFNVVGWSVSGDVAAASPGSATCAVRADASAIEYLTGVACPPAGFSRVLGYEPVLVRTQSGWRFVRPDGECSGPLADRGPFWDFADACGTHDYGYDLVRFGVGDRSATDALFRDDLLRTCAGEGLGEAPCKALAEWAYAGLRIGEANGFSPERIDDDAGSG